MTKQEFISFMNEFMGKREEVEEFYQDLDKCFGNIDKILENSYEGTVVDLLELALGDKDGWIDWFLYDNDGKLGCKYWGGKQECILSSYGELYDIITS